MAKDNHYELLKETHEIVGGIDNKLDKLATRVSSLEIWKAGLEAKIAAVAGIVSLAFVIVWDFVKSKIKLN